MAFDNASVSADSIHVCSHPSSLAQESLLYVETAGLYRVTEKYHISRICFGSFLIIVLTEGRMLCSNENETVTAGPGDIVLLETRKPHTYYALRPSNFSFIHFGGQEAERLVQHIRNKSGMLVKGNHGQVINAMIQDQIGKLQAAEMDEFSNSAFLYQLLMTVYSDAVQSSLPTDEAQLIEQIQSYILAHLPDHLTIEQLAAQAGYSVPYFSQIFRHVTGYAPYAFILKARLEHSQHLLLKTTLSIQEVAERSGFPSQANFSYMFRKEFGYTPTTYRKMSAG